MSGSLVLRHVQRTTATPFRYTYSTAAHYPSFQFDLKPTPIPNFIAQYAPLVPTPQSKMQTETCALAGRIVSIRHASSKLKFITLKTLIHSVQIVCSFQHFTCESNWTRFIDRLHLGDIAYVPGFPGRTKSNELSLYATEFHTVSPTKRDIPFKQGISDPETRSRNRTGDLLTNAHMQSYFIARSKLISTLRHTLQEMECTEFQTPILSTSAGGASAKPFMTRSASMGTDLYLRVSPELFLKRLVVGGFDRVFEIGQQFRNEGVDALHHPEFTSCEAYFAYFNLNDLMAFTHMIVAKLAVQVTGNSVVNVAQDSARIDFGTPYRVIDIVPFLESKLQQALPDLESNSAIAQLIAILEKNRFSLPPKPHTVPRLLDALISLWIVPQCIQPTIVKGHPLIMSPLAKSCSNNPKIASRFELYVAGQELVNAYEELNDPNEQRTRFIHQQQHKEQGDEEAQVHDEPYCRDLEYGMPPTAGWGLGIDRLVMLFTGAQHIRQVIPFPIVKPNYPHLSGNEMVPQSIIAQQQTTDPYQSFLQLGYKMGQTIGEGEFGKVKLAYQASTSMQVAVKLCKRSTFEESHERQSKLQREIALLSTLNHPNICRLIEVLESDKYIGLVLDYASGGELFDYILDKEYLSELEAGRLFAQLMDGVHYLHSHCIVHRDLKLENLLLSEDNNLIIIDFGFANQFPSSSKHDHSGVPDPIPDRDYFMSTSCGSPCYAAPELVVSSGYTGTCADIWSCGVILFAMLSGYLPFDDDPNNLGGENIPMLYAYILSVPTPLHIPPHLSPDACNLLQIMIIPDPSFRASLNQVILHPWLKPWRRVLASYKSSLSNTSLCANNNNDELSDDDDKPLKPPFDPESTLSTLSANLSKLERKVSTRSQNRQSNTRSTNATPDMLDTVEHNKSPKLSLTMHDSSLTLSNKMSISTSEKAKSPVLTTTKLQEPIAMSPKKMKGLEHENIKFGQTLTAEPTNSPELCPTILPQLPNTSEMQQGSDNTANMSQPSAGDATSTAHKSLPITPEQQKCLDERTHQSITAEQSSISDVHSTAASHLPSSISEHSLASLYTSSVRQAPLIPVRTIPNLGTPNVSPMDDVESIQESESDTSSVFSDHDIDAIPPIPTITVPSDLLESPSFSKNTNSPNNIPKDIYSVIPPSTPAPNSSSELNEIGGPADCATLNALDDNLPPVLPIENMIQSPLKPTESVISKEFVSDSVACHDNNQLDVPLTETKYVLDDNLPPVTPIENMIQSPLKPTESVISKEFVSDSVVCHDNNQLVVPLTETKYVLDDNLPPVSPIENMIQSPLKPTESVISKEFVSDLVACHDNNLLVVPLTETKYNSPITNQAELDDSHTPPVTASSKDDQAQLNGQQMETSRPTSLGSPVKQQQITPRSSLTSFHSAYSSPGASNLLARKRVGHTTPPLGFDHQIIQPTEILHLTHVDAVDTREQIDQRFSITAHPAQSRTVSPVVAVPVNPHTSSQSPTSPIQSNIMENDAEVLSLSDQLILTPSSHVLDQQTIEPGAFSDPLPLTTIIHTRDQSANKPLPIFQPQARRTELPEKKGRPTSLIYELPGNQQTSDQSLISSRESKRMSLDASFLPGNQTMISGTVSNNHKLQSGGPVDMPQSLSTGLVLTDHTQLTKNDLLTEFDHVKTNVAPVQSSSIVHTSPLKQQITGKSLSSSIHNPETSPNALEPNQHPTLFHDTLTNKGQIKEQEYDFTSDPVNPSRPTSMADDFVVKQHSIGFSPAPSIENKFVSQGSTVEPVTSTISNHNPKKDTEISSKSIDLLPEDQSSNHLSPTSGYSKEINHPILSADASEVNPQTTSQSMLGSIQSNHTSPNARAAVTPPHPIHQQKTVSAAISKLFSVNKFALKEKQISKSASNPPIKTLEQQRTDLYSESSFQSTGTALDAIVLSMHEQIANITSSLDHDSHSQFENLPSSDIKVVEDQLVDSDSPAFDQAQYEILFLRNKQTSLSHNVTPVNEKNTIARSRAPSIASAQTSSGTSYLSNQQAYGSPRAGATQPAISSSELPGSPFSPGKEPRSQSSALPNKSHVTGYSMPSSTQSHSPVPNTQVRTVKGVLPVTVDTCMIVSKQKGKHYQSPVLGDIEHVKTHDTGSSFSPFDYEQPYNSERTLPQLPSVPDQVQHLITPIKSDKHIKIRAKAPLNGSAIDKLTTIPLNLTFPSTNLKKLPPLPVNHIENQHNESTIDKSTKHPVNLTPPSANLNSIPRLPDTLLSNEELYGDLFRPLDEDPDILNLLGSIKVNFTPPNNSPQIPETPPVYEPLTPKSQSTPNLAHVSGSIIFDINHIPTGYNLPTQSTASTRSPNVPNFPKTPKSYFWEELRLSASKLKWRVTQGTDSMVSTFSKHTTSSSSSHLDLPSPNLYYKSMSISSPVIRSSSNELMPERARPNQVLVSTKHDKSLPQFSSSSAPSYDTYPIHYDTTKQTYSTKLRPFRSHRHSNEVFSRTSISSAADLSQTSHEIQYAPNIPTLVSNPDYEPQRLRSRSLVSKIRRGLSLNNQSGEIFERSDIPPLPSESSAIAENASIAEQNKASNVHSRRGEDAEPNKRGQVMGVIGSKRRVRRGRSLTNMMTGISKLENSKPLPPMPSAFVSSTLPNICTVSESKSFPSIALTTRKPEVALLQVQRVLEGLGTTVIGDKSDPTQGLVGHGTGHFLLKCRLNLGKKYGITATRLKSELDALEYGVHNKKTDYNPICLPSVSQIRLNSSSRLNGPQIQSNHISSSSLGESIEQRQKLNGTHVKDPAQLFMDILPSPPPVHDSTTLPATSARYSVNTSNGHLASSNGRSRSSSSIARSLTAGILPFGNELLFSVEIVGLPTTLKNRTTWAIKFRRIKGSSVSYNRVKHIVLRKLARSNTESQTLVD